MTARFDVVGVVVDDMARSLAFYRRLGLDIPPSADGEGHVEVGLPGGLRLAFDTVEVIHSFHPHWTPPTGGQRVGLAFLCEGPAEVDRLFAELAPEDVDSVVEPFDAPWGQRYAVVRDPDGNGVDLFAPSAA